LKSGDNHYVVEEEMFEVFLVEATQSPPLRLCSTL